jgi:hypothetical protein
MTRSEAMAIARAFVPSNTGVDADPDHVRPDEGPASARTWYVLDYAAHFFPEVAAGGSTADDGGAGCVLVDDATGQVSGYE